VRYQEGIKINVSKRGLFLKFSSVEKNLCSQLGKTSVLFSPKLSVLNCASLCDSSLLIMSAKDKKSEVFSKNQM